MDFILSPLTFSKLFLPSLWCTPIKWSYRNAAESNIVKPFDLCLVPSCRFDQTFFLRICRMNDTGLKISDIVAHLYTEKQTSKRCRVLNSNLIGSLRREGFHDTDLELGLRSH